MLSERIAPAPCSRDTAGTLDGWIRQMADGDKDALAALYRETRSSI